MVIKMLKFREFRSVIEFRDLYRSHEGSFSLKFSKITTMLRPRS